MNRWLVLALGLVACGTAVSSVTNAEGGSPDTGTNDANVGLDGGQDDAIFVAGDSQPPDSSDYANYVDGGGACAPDAAQMPWSHKDCCENGTLSCNGYCVRPGTLDAGCDCFGVLGGCANGTICCFHTMSCTKDYQCAMP